MYISFDPVQITLLDTLPSPTLRLSYLGGGRYLREITRDVELSATVLSQMIKLMERLPERDFSGMIFFPKERLTIKFRQRIKSNNRYLDVIRGQLYRVFFSIPIPLALNMRIRVESFQTMLMALKELSKNGVAA